MIRRTIKNGIAIGYRCAEPVHLKNLEFKLSFARGETENGVLSGLDRLKIDLVALGIRGARAPDSLFWGEGGGNGWNSALYADVIKALSETAGQHEIKVTRNQGGL